jgi:hypothetical protein
MTGPWFRKLLLLCHVVSSVGWFGAAAAYAGLVAGALGSPDAQEVRAACVATEPTMRLAIVPLALVSLSSGLLQSLATAWGLVRYYWVIYKIVLTLVATAVLLVNARTIAALARAAKIAQGPDLGALKGQLVHASLGMLVLLLITALSVYKPKGVTRYGWRKLHGQTAVPG